MRVDKKLIKKISITCFLLLCLFISHSSTVDTVAEEYTEQGIKRTLLTYAVSRSLNGVISVAQGTQVAVSPAGVGLTFAPGQILDPVNDLIERFSWVMMVSGASLGIQRLFLEITSSQGIVWLLSTFILLYLVFLWLDRPEAKDIFNWKRIFLKSVIVFIFIRFSVPVIALVNEGVYVGYLHNQYEVAQKKLETATENIKIIHDDSREDVKKNIDEGIVEKVEQWLDKTQRSLDVERQMSSFKQAAADISQQVINMIVVFIVQTIIFPLLFLWILVKSAKIIMIKISV